MMAMLAMQQTMKQMDAAEVAGEGSPIRADKKEGEAHDSVQIAAAWPSSVQATTATNQ